jgi:GR25 family glycosyltransferase involved in LPS biosynthesis
VRPVSRLKPSQVSVVAKHHFAMYDMLRQRRGLAVILEDDALLRVNFTRRLDEVLASLRLPAAADGAPRYDFDLLMIGGCLKMHAYRKKFRADRVSKHVFLKPEARCAHAYVVTARGAERFLAAMPLTLPIDFQLTSAVREAGLRAMWVEPWLSVQGSFGGCVTQDIYKSCPSVEKYDRAYDVKFVNDSSVDAMWDVVPDIGQR